MSYIFSLVFIFCSDQRVWPKFQTVHSTKGLAIMQCENAMKDCFNLTGDIVHCAQRVWDMK